MIDRYFGLDTVEEIIEAMVRDLCLRLDFFLSHTVSFNVYLLLQENEVADSGNEWCKKTLKQVKEASPLSLKITLQSVSPFLPLLCQNAFHFFSDSSGYFLLLDTRR